MPPHDPGDLLHTAAETGGAAVSAYRPGTPASRATLRTTAQLIAALSAAVVLVEAVTDSLAMEAAATARQLDRPVFAVPSDAGAPTGR